MSNCGRGSAGRASPCQGEGRGFESRRPLQKNIEKGPEQGPFAGSLANYGYAPLTHRLNTSVFVFITS